MSEYLRWQFVEGPIWLLELAWNLQRMLARTFSVSLMLRTLFAHWHKDAVSYKLAGLSSILTTFAWNQISRGVGFVVRLCALFVWLWAAAALLAVNLAFIAFFMTWPLLIAGGVVVAILVLAGL